MAKKKRTLVQAVRDLFSQKVKPDVLEFSIFNPLAARRGDTLKIASLPFLPDSVRRIGMDLVEIDEYSRVLEGKSYPFTDYVCRYREADEDRYVTLRVIPRDDRPPESSMLVLVKDWEDVYQEALHKKELPSGTYRVRDTSDRRRNKIVYQRNAGLKTPYEATVREVKENQDEISKYGVHFWDFVRSLPEEDGGGHEFYYIEMEADNGMMRGYVGREVPAEEVELIKTQAAREMM